MQVQGLTKTKGATVIRSKGPYRRKNLKQWINFINSKPKDDVIVDWLLLEDIKKQGYDPDFNPASYFDVNQMWDALNDYDSGFNADSDYFYQNDYFKKAISLAFKIFGNFDDNLEPITDQKELYKTIQKSSSAGLPSLGSKEKAFPTSYMRMKDVRDGKKAFNPCLAQFRTQRKRDENGVPVGKTRNVFAYPLDANLFEAQYFYPMFKRIIRKRTPYSGGLLRFELGSRLSSTLRKKHIYEFDYSRFDASIPRGLIRICFEIFKTWFDASEHRNIDKIFQYFVNTPIVMPDGNLYVGKNKGVPSGSCYTQLVDTIVNFILCFAINDKFKLGLNWYEAHFVGDDAIFTSNKFVHMDKIALFANRFGFTINPSKSRILNSGQRFHFVGFYFEKGLASKDFDEVISNICYPERPRSFKDNEDHLANMYREIGLLSLKSTKLLRARVNSFNRGEFIESLTMRSNLRSQSGYLQYRDRYIFNSTERINFLSGEYLR